jgi:hypothetical protein
MNAGAMRASGFALYQIAPPAAELCRSTGRAIMRSLLCPARRLARATAVPVLVLILAVPPSTALAQSKLTAQYTISVAGIPIGRGDLAAEIAVDRYLASGGGRASGFLRILVSGEGSVTARGRLVDGRPVPANFSAIINDDDERSTVTIGFDNGVVTEFAANSSAPKEDRIPVLDEHRKGVIDPVSAMLVPGRPDTLTAEACQRTLPIFDGTRRYDLALSYKRMDKVKTAAGYQGPVVVCAAALRPIAGHRTDSALVKYLSDGRDLELWLAPIAGTSVLGPYRLSVANLIGNLVIEAVRYESAVVPVAQVTTTTGKTPP